MNTPNTKTLAAAGAVLLVAAAGYYWLSRPSAPALQPVAAPTSGAQIEGGRLLRFPAGAPQLSYLRIEAVQSLPAPLIEPLNGRVAYDDNATARIFAPVSGRILALPVQAGDRVAAGASLAVLDIPDYADLQKADADRRMRQSAYDRAKLLFENEALARKDLEAAENDLAGAEAESARAHARLRNLRPISGQSGFALRTPLAGIVTERQANPGMEVRPDQDRPLFVVSDPAHLWVIAEVAEKDLARVRVGQPVGVEVDAYPQRRFGGRVLAVGDVVDSQSRRVPVRCSVDNGERLLKPEMFARVTPETEGVHLPRVPNSAVVTEGVNDFVFVEKTPGVIEKRPVKLAFRGHEASFVRDGLSAGERVITAGALLLNAELGGA
ncbi:efflux RND transporter periplasmic adaptor subunit [Rhodocyclus tenuis]|uniref:Efflux RND transporter periplasmic adaptor subunit n=2 Tax=Rhodocyclus TaxID=1064 RepID=A0A6L5JZL5_RHOTE|nr:efflux RND transporter periplasmic adaptor subunit [Rhodocyclus gracilis]MQY51678.1 efflux RND transporter periplasmic adaptor subunit [Rhodocyclus gracilis]NJA89061.1 efflux RND transporter periplasmic adaptor subunit [Rhodocyclus gracilis]